MSLISTVKDELYAIRHMAGDPEAAHVREDMLVKHVLHAIADGCKDPAALAAEAIKVYDIDFPRWYA